MRLQRRCPLCVCLLFNPIPEATAKTMCSDVAPAHASQQHQERHVGKTCPVIAMEDVFVVLRGDHASDDFDGAVGKWNAVLPSCLHSFSRYRPNTSVEVD